MRDIFASALALLALPLVAIACGAGADEHPSSSDQDLGVINLGLSDASKVYFDRCELIDPGCSTQPDTWVAAADSHGLEPLLQAAGCSVPFYFSNPPYGKASEVSLCPNTIAVHYAVSQFQSSDWYSWVKISSDSCNSCMGVPPAGKAWVNWATSIPCRAPECKHKPVCPSSCKAPGI